MFRINLNQIYNMNCNEGLNYIPDKSIDLVIIDPPYDVKTSGGGKILHRRCVRYIKEISPMSKGISLEIIEKICYKLKKINIYIWCSRNQIPVLLNYFLNKNCNYTLISWHKTNPIPACNNKYLSDTEYCLFFREKGVKLGGNFHSKFTYYVTSLNTKDKAKYNHPTVKPLKIIKNFIKNSSNENDVVLDCFLGSETTAVACIKTNRNYIGFEIDKSYYTTACNRISEAKGQVKP
jgi:site-specific DNA-methyltransferase (adenine-specific)